MLELPSSTLLAFAFLVVACGGTAVGTETSDGGDDGAALPTQCKDDRPPPHSASAQGGVPCTLPDGGAGVGDGEWGCIDPTACKCTPQAGRATCVVAHGTGRCVYDTCNSADQDQACKLPDGSEGVCCQDTCAKLDFLTDPGNCGGCGLVCGTGATCNGGTCNRTCGGSAGAAAPCPPGTECYGAPSSTAAWNSSLCLATDCSRLPDGATCAFGATAVDGLCCAGTCVSWGSNENCGGCGIKCCAGTTCNPTNPGVALCF